MKIFACVPALIFIGVLAACGSSDGNSTSIDDSPEAFAYSAKEKLKEALKDPDSAQFRNVVAYRLPTDDGKKVYVFCGEVNAKNGFGGYSGFERFVGNGGMIVMESQAEDLFDGVWDQYCKPTLREKDMNYF